MKFCGHGFCFVWLFVVCLCGRGILTLVHFRQEYIDKQMGIAQVAAKQRVSA